MLLPSAAVTAADAAALTCTHKACRAQRREQRRQQARSSVAGGGAERGGRTSAAVCMHAVATSTAVSCCLSARHCVATAACCFSAARAASPQQNSSSGCAACAAAAACMRASSHTKLLPALTREPKPNGCVMAMSCRSSLNTCAYSILACTTAAQPSSSTSPNFRIWLLFVGLQGRVGRWLRCSSSKMVAGQWCWLSLLPALSRGCWG